MSTTVIETYTGRYFDYADPDPESISLEDIAQALSNECRFGGHITFYSVAEHALLCQRLLEMWGYGPRTQLGGLHHDDHEAYMKDIPTPLKRRFGPVVKEVAGEIDTAISLRLGLDSDWFSSAPVVWADEQALMIEAAALKRSGGTGAHWANRPHPERPDFWVPGRPREIVKQEFIEAHNRLSASL